MGRLCCDRYFRPGKVREENPDLSTLPWPPRPVGPEAHRENKQISKAEAAQVGLNRRKANYEVLFALIGYSVEISSAWRLPYYAYRNGGGTFILAYLIIAVMLGLPLIFMEIALGQYTSSSQIKVWRLCPIAKGIGYVGLIVTMVRLVFYPVIIVYAMFYLIGSFDSQLPWASCGNFWNTPACWDGNGSPVNASITGANQSMSSIYVPAEEFWLNRVLGLSNSISDVGSLKWELFLLLTLVWFITGLATSKGIRSFGKAVYVTATFPFVAMLMLLIRGATLPGALDGVKFFVTPDWSRLLTPGVWSDAVLYSIYSFGIASGPFINLGSYNKFHNNCQRDAIIVMAANIVTDLMAGFTVFTVLGFLSVETGRPIELVTTSEQGLAFVSYSTGLAKLPIAPVWSVIFFLMLFFLGIGSMFGEVNAIVSAIIEEIPKLKPKKWLVNVVLCFVIGAAGIVIVTQSGAYWVNLIEWHAGAYPLLIITLLEVITVMYVYGYPRFADDIYTMLGVYPNWFWVISWNIITPIALLFLVIVRIIGPQKIYFENYTYPFWAEAVGWGLAITALSALPIAALYIFFKTVTTKGFSLRDLVRPTIKWGPAVNVHRHERGLAPLQPMENPYDRTIHGVEQDVYNQIHITQHSSKKTEANVLDEFHLDTGAVPEPQGLEDTPVTGVRERRVSRPPSYHTQAGQNNPYALYPDLDPTEGIPTEVLMQQSTQSEFRIIETPQTQQHEDVSHIMTNLIPQPPPPPLQDQASAAMTIPINLQINLVPQEGYMPQLPTETMQQVPDQPPAVIVQQQPHPVPQPLIPPMSTPQTLLPDQIQTAAPHQQVFTIASSGMSPVIPSQAAGVQAMPVNIANHPPMHVVPEELYTTWHPTEPSFSVDNAALPPVTAFVSPPAGLAYMTPPQAMAPAPPCSFTNFATLEQYKAVSSPGFVQTVPTSMRTIVACPAPSGKTVTFGHP